MKLPTRWLTRGTLALGVLTAAPMTLQQCSPNVHADCTAPDGSTFRYDGGKLGMPAGCSVTRQENPDGSWFDIGPALPPVTASDVAPARIEEDQPGWDCHTMGNRSCGAGAGGWSGQHVLANCTRPDDGTPYLADTYVRSLPPGCRVIATGPVA